MANVLKLILSAAVGAVSIASPALAQYAFQSDPSISVHRSKNLRISSHQSGSRASPRCRRFMIQEGGGIRLLIDKSPYSTAVLVDNENLHLDHR
jgi:hypothetical protein